MASHDRRDGHARPAASSVSGYWCSNSGRALMNAHTAPDGRPGGPRIRTTCPRPRETSPSTGGFTAPSAPAGTARAEITAANPPVWYKPTSQVGDQPPSPAALPRHIAQRARQGVEMNCAAG